jgi:hypothetical protein
MSLSLVHSRALVGLQAPAVTVEVHLANGLPSFTLVGLADVEVKEARERVRSANDIVDVIGAALPLKRNGANFVCLCPFHKEKSPSFNVNSSKQIFHCVLHIFANLLKVRLTRVHVPLVVGNRNDNGDTELLLNLFGHLEGDHVTQVQSLCLWALGEGHIERLALLQKLSEAALLGKVDAA